MQGPGFPAGLKLALRRRVPFAAAGCPRPPQRATRKLVHGRRHSLPAGQRPQARPLPQARGPDISPELDTLGHNTLA